MLHDSNGAKRETYNGKQFAACTKVHQVGLFFNEESSFDLNSEMLEYETDCRRPIHNQFRRWSLPKQGEHILYSDRYK